LEILPVPTRPTFSGLDMFLILPVLFFFGTLRASVN
jgi:hypothetical protein